MDDKYKLTFVYFSIHSKSLFSECRMFKRIIGDIAALSIVK